MVSRRIESICKRVLACVAVAAVVFPFSVLAAEPTVLDFELKNLRAPEVHSLNKYRGMPVLLMFFEPECSWCFRQVRAFNRLRQRCQVSPIAIGVNANRQALSRELRRIRPDFPAYQASPALLKALGGVPGTPFTLIIDPNGNIASWLRGFVPLSDLTGVFSKNDIPCDDAAA